MLIQVLTCCQKLCGSPIRWKCTLTECVLRWLHSLIMPSSLHDNKLFLATLYGLSLLNGVWRSSKPRLITLNYKNLAAHTSTLGQACYYALPMSHFICRCTNLTTFSRVPPLYLSNGLSILTRSLHHYQRLTRLYDCLFPYAHPNMLDSAP